MERSHWNLRALYLQGKHPPNPGPGLDGSVRGMSLGALADGRWIFQAGLKNGWNTEDMRSAAKLAI